MWTKEEDAVLRCAVQLHGHEWSAIAASGALPSKSADGCGCPWYGADIPPGGTAMYAGAMPRPAAGVVWM